MPEEVLVGAMLPFGRHKGSAIALMVELMAGSLIGDLTSGESLERDGGRGTAPFGGELMLAINPDAFGRPGGAGSAEALFKAVTDQEARLPSLRRYAARRRAEADGLHISRALLDEIAQTLG